MLSSLPPPATPGDNGPGVNAPLLSPTTASHIQMGSFGRIVVIRRNGDDGVAYPLNQAEVTFGRELSCTIRVRFEEVSRIHCILQVDPATRKVYLQDRSSNGTFLNGKELGVSEVDGTPNKVRLKHGDRFTIQSRDFRFEYPVQEEVEDYLTEHPDTTIYATPSRILKATASLPTNEDDIPDPEPPRPILPQTVRKHVLQTEEIDTPKRRKTRPSQPFASELDNTASKPTSKLTEKLLSLASPSKVAASPKRVLTGTPLRVAVHTAPMESSPAPFGPIVDSQEEAHEPSMNLVEDVASTDKPVSDPENPFEETPSPPTTTTTAPPSVLSTDSVAPSIKPPTTTTPRPAFKSMTPHPTKPSGIPTSSAAGSKSVPRYLTGTRSSLAKQQSPIPARRALKTASSESLISFSPVVGAETSVAPAVTAAEDEEMEEETEDTLEPAAVGDLLMMAEDETTVAGACLVPTPVVEHIVAEMDAKPAEGLSISTEAVQPVVGEDADEPKTPENQEMDADSDGSASSRKKAVTFGPPLSPEIFNKEEPSSTPLKRGVRQHHAASPSGTVLKSALRRTLLYPAHGSPSKISKKPQHPLATSLVKPYSKLNAPSTPTTKTTSLRGGIPATTSKVPFLGTPTLQRPVVMGAAARTASPVKKKSLKDAFRYIPPAETSVSSFYKAAAAIQSVAADAGGDGAAVVAVDTPVKKTPVKAAEEVDSMRVDSSEEKEEEQVVIPATPVPFAMTPRRALDDVAVMESPRRSGRRLSVAASTTPLVSTPLVAGPTPVPSETVALAQDVTDSPRRSGRKLCVAASSSTTTVAESDSPTKSVALKTSRRVSLFGVAGEKQAAAASVAKLDERAGIQPRRDRRVSLFGVAGERDLEEDNVRGMAGEKKTRGVMTRRESILKSVGGVVECEEEDEEVVVQTEDDAVDETEDAPVEDVEVLSVAATVEDSVGLADSEDATMEVEAVEDVAMPIQQTEIDVVQHAEEEAMESVESIVVQETQQEDVPLETPQENSLSVPVEDEQRDEEEIDDDIRSNLATVAASGAGSVVGEAAAMEFDEEDEVGGEESRTLAGLMVSPSSLKLVEADVMVDEEAEVEQATLEVEAPVEESAVVEVDTEELAAIAAVEESQKDGDVAGELDADVEMKESTFEPAVDNVTVSKPEEDGSDSEYEYEYVEVEEEVEVSMDSGEVVGGVGDALEAAVDPEEMVQENAFEDDPFPQDMEVEETQMDEDVDKPMAACADTAPAAEGTPEPEPCSATPPKRKSARRNKPTNEPLREPSSPTHGSSPARHPHQELEDSLPVPAKLASTADEIELPIPGDTPAESNTIAEKADEDLVAKPTLSAPSTPPTSALPSVAPKSTPKRPTKPNFGAPASFYPTEGTKIESAAATPHHEQETRRVGRSGKKAVVPPPPVEEGVESSEQEESEESEEEDVVEVPVKSRVLRAGKVEEPVTASKKRGTRGAKAVVEEEKEVVMAEVEIVEDEVVVPTTATKTRAGLRRARSDQSETKRTPAPVKKGRGRGSVKVEAEPEVESDEEMEKEVEGVAEIAVAPATGPKKRVGRGVKAVEVEPELEAVDIVATKTTPAPVKKGRGRSSAKMEVEPEVESDEEMEQEVEGVAEIVAAPATGPKKRGIRGVKAAEVEPEPEAVAVVEPKVTAAPVKPKSKASKKSKYESDLALALAESIAQLEKEESAVSAPPTPKGKSSLPGVAPKSASKQRMKPVDMFPVKTFYPVESAAVAKGRHVDEDSEMMDVEEEEEEAAPVHETRHGGRGRGKAEKIAVVAGPKKGGKRAKAVHVVEEMDVSDAEPVVVAATQNPRGTGWAVKSVKKRGGAVEEVENVHEEEEQVIVDAPKPRGRPGKAKKPVVVEVEEEVAMVVEPEVVESKSSKASKASKAGGKKQSKKQHAEEEVMEDVVIEKHSLRSKKEVVEDMKPVAKRGAAKADVEKKAAGRSSRKPAKLQTPVGAKKQVATQQNAPARRAPKKVQAGLTGKKSKPPKSKEQGMESKLSPQSVEVVAGPPPVDGTLEPPKPKTPVMGAVQILYNHYHEKFPIRNGILSGADVDEKYAFSFVFKGNFQILLRHAETNEVIPKIESSRWDFENLVDGNSYLVEIELDPEEEKRLESRAPGSYGYKANSSTIKSGNTASDLITKELKGMTQEQLMEKGDRYRELIEARELENALYS
ncbi:antigen identified by monoclonal antibody Ki-67 [Podochytrium sp. JEL0797]|nr:antigen identified by monoclonal antibody Ki-67 [Podochytrium sp. JEL0797]